MALLLVAATVVLHVHARPYTSIAMVRLIDLCLNPNCCLCSR